MSFSFGHPSDTDEELDEELEIHLRLLVEERTGQGDSQEEAWLYARRKLGNKTLIREAIYELWSYARIESLLLQLRSVLQTLVRNPVFSTLAIAILSLGIAASTGIITVIETTVFHPLPYRNANQLVEITPYSSTDLQQHIASLAEFKEWKSRTDVFSNVGAIRGQLFVVTGSGRPEQVDGDAVSTNLLELLGVAPILGHSFRNTPTTPRSDHVALISWRLWHERFHEDPDASRWPLILDGEPYTVIGVMPHTFRFPEQSDVWIPLTPTGEGTAAQWTNRYLRVFGRLRPGQTIRSATARMSDVSTHLGRQHPEYERNIDIRLIRLRSRLLDKFRIVLAVIFFGVAGMFFAVCANIAGLLMSKTIAKQHEFALRAALGATRKRLLGHTLTETLLLGLSGGAMGLLLAIFALPLLKQLIPNGMATFISESNIESTMPYIACCITAIAVVISGIGPAAIILRIDTRASLRPDISVKSGVSLFRKLLVTVEVFIATVLLCQAASLQMRISSLTHVELGFNPHNILTMRTTIPMSQASVYKEFAKRAALYRRILDKITSLPGVISAGYTTYLPLTNRSGVDRFVIEGSPRTTPSQQAVAVHRVVSSQYLGTMGVQLLRGRYFDSRDNESSSPAAIVNSIMAGRYWPGLDPVGRRFRLADESLWVTVVGVVGDIRQVDLDTAGEPEVYFSCDQAAGAIGFYAPRDLAVLVKREPLELAADVKDSIWSIVPNQSISDVRSMDSIVQNELAPRRMARTVLAGFAAAAFLLAVLGLYALAAHETIQRNKAITIKIAVGALRSQLILRLVWMRFQLVLAGCLSGIACEVLARPALRIYWGEIPTNTGLIYIGVAFVMLGVGLCTCFIATKNSMPNDLVKVLRYE